MFNYACIVSITTTFDALAYAKELECAGLTREHAEFQANAMRKRLENQSEALQKALDSLDEAQRRELATNADVL